MVINRDSPSILLCACTVIYILRIASGEEVLANGVKFAFTAHLPYRNAEDLTIGVLSDVCDWVHVQEGRRN